MEPDDLQTEKLTRVRATVNLPGLRVGQTALVDPSVPYIAECLETEVLVPVEGEGAGDGQ